MNIDFSQVVTPQSEEVKAAEYKERLWRGRELDRADIQLFKVEDGMKGLGTQKAWREYRIALRDYPASEDFMIVRPVAPDA
jgi:hypothetical protein